MRLTLRQIENPRAGVRPRELVLDGRMGPIDGLTWGGSQRGDVAWLPGSSVAAVRFDGPEERPTDFRFVWRGRDFTVGDAVLDGRPLVDLDSLVDALDTMRRDTALVEIVWRGRTQKAKIESFEPEEGLAFEWTATLSVQWVEAPSRFDPSARSRPNPISFADSMLASFDAAMDGVVATVTWALGPVEAMERDISRTRAAISQLKTAALSLTNAAQSVVSVTRSIAATIQQVITSSEEVADSAAVSADILAQTDDAAQQIGARLFRARLSRAARRSRHQGALARRSYRPESDIITIHQAVSGETIWSVARLYYGRPDRAGDIARRNNLISTTLRAGQRIAVPA